MIKLFASDLDGTLLNENHELDEIIINTIKNIHDHGKAFAIATGRHMHQHLMDDFKDIQGLYYTVCMNGAVIYDQKHHLLKSISLNKDFVRNLLERFPRIYFECYTLDHTYMRCTKDEHYENFSKTSIWKDVQRLEKFEHYTQSNIYGCTNDMICDQDILKINCRVYDEKLRNELDEFLNLNHHLVTNAPFQEGAYEITDIDANKGKAVKYLAKILGVCENEVAVYGDGGNDLEMLSMFKHSFATSNAMDHAKEVANTTIGDCKDHAVSQHIKMLLVEDIL